MDFEEFKKRKKDRQDYVDSLSENHPMKTDREQTYCPSCFIIFNYCECGWYQEFDKRSSEVHIASYRGVNFCFKSLPEALKFLEVNNHYDYQHGRVIDS